MPDANLYSLYNLEATTLHQNKVLIVLKSILAHTEVFLKNILPHTVVARPVWLQSTYIVQCPLFSRDQSCTRLLTYEAKTKMPPRTQQA